MIENEFHKKCKYCGVAIITVAITLSEVGGYYCEKCTHEHTPHVAEADYVASLFTGTTVIVSGQITSSSVVSGLYTPLD